MHKKAALSSTAEGDDKAQALLSGRFGIRERQQRQIGTRTRREIVHDGSFGASMRQNGPLIRSASAAFKRLSC